jgi:hypothetical protein
MTTNIFLLIRDAGSVYETTFGYVIDNRTL